jgi:signal peptidase II
MPVAKQMFSSEAIHSPSDEPVNKALAGGSRDHGALRPRHNPLDRVGPVSDPTPVTPGVSPGLPSSVASDAPAQDSSPEALVPGDRLATPYGASPVWPDYGRPTPSYAFLALVSILTLAADIASKSWAERHLDGYPGLVEIWKNHLTLILARNRGGAWGLLQSTSENVRRPFFLLVSIAAIAFIMTLYRRLQPRQYALMWGLPLVLGGALGNVFDRIRYGLVIDFIDAHIVYRGAERHWPTFNIADVAICVGVGLMAVDMFTSRRGRPPLLQSSPVPPAQSGERVPGWRPFGSDAPAPAEPEKAEAPEAPAT